jgi:hypothetical protein
MTSPTASFSQRERGSALTATVSVLAAIIITGLVIAAFYFFLTPPPTSEGQVLSLDVFPIHNTSGGGIIAGGISGQPESFNEVIVLANVAIKNTAKVPISLLDMDSYLYIPNSDNIYQNGAASHQDFERVFMAYPQLKSKEGKPLRRDTILAPGQQIAGQLIYHYPLTLAQWQSRTKLHIIIAWAHQDNLILKLKGSQTSTGWQH